jgi:pimeloyl-ACP methyl ester carboxylesterase
MSDYRRVICTLHGINTEGPWQREIAQELEPHFRCIPLKYPQFRWLGWPKILHPLLRRAAVKTVARQLSQKAAPVERGNLIAHSFGTWISLQLMKRPERRFNRVIFTASPLSADLDWDAELQDNPEAFQDLTNEYGSEDKVLAWGDFATGKDCAGQVGFRGRPDRIHDTRAFRLSCRLCRDLPQSSQATIHNLEWSAFHHSGWWVGSGHCGSLWLPYFWGFPPEEYADFIEACLALAESESNGDIVNKEYKEKAFRERAWTWTRSGDASLPLIEYVEKGIGLYRTDEGLPPLDPSTIQNHRARAIRLVWRLVQEAIEERRLPVAKRREDILRWLHPLLAIRAAIQGVEKESWTTSG